MWTFSAGNFFIIPRIFTDINSLSTLRHHPHSRYIYPTLLHRVSLIWSKRRCPCVTLRVRSTRWRHRGNESRLDTAAAIVKIQITDPAAVNKTIVFPSLPLNPPRALTYFFTLLTSFHARAIDSPSERPNGCAVWQIELFKVEIHETREEAHGSSPRQRSWRAAWKIVLITQW